MQARTDEEYRQLVNSGKFGGMTADDMKWIDENVGSGRKLFITLTEEDQKLVRDIAKKRTDHAKKKGFYNNWGSVDGYDIDLEGFGAEVAFCRLFKCEPDVTIGLKKDDYDTITKKGSKVDVKWTQNINNGLLVKVTKEKKKTDVYVLTTGNFPSYEVIGYAYQADVFQESNIEDSKFGHKNHHIGLDKLKSF